MRRFGTVSAKTKVALRPLNDRIVVEAKELEVTTKSGIVLPDTAKEKPQRGIVLAAGPGRLLDNGSREPMDVAAGQEILFAKYAGTEIKIEGEEYLILKASDVLAIIQE
jgi:chaperonin GroES